MKMWWNFDVVVDFDAKLAYRGLDTHLLAILQSSNGLRQEDMCASSGSLAWPLCQHDPVGKIDISKSILWSFILRLVVNHVT